MPNPQPQDQPTTVLVVDDEDGIRHALDRFLTRLGYRVLQASSGAEALDRQAAEQPGVWDAVQKVAKGLGASGDGVQREIRKRPGGSLAWFAGFAFSSHGLQRVIPGNEQMRQMKVPQSAQGYPSEARSSLPQ